MRSASFERQKPEISVTNVQDILYEWPFKQKYPKNKKHSTLFHGHIKNETVRRDKHKLNRYCLNQDTDTVDYLPKLIQQ